VADLLLVDNDERITGLLAFFLERHGHRVRVAASYARARQCIAEKPPELLLGDLELGAERGDEELLRLHREGNMPPTLVVSGYLDAELEGRLRQLPGLCGTLAKPFALEALIASVDAALAVAEGLAGAATPTAPAGQDLEPEQDDEAWIEIRPLGGGGG
jgi:DNA-binding response OmpR family regulator